MDPTPGYRGPYANHAVYDLQFSDSGAVTKVDVYYEDIAGIEGVRWYVVAVIVFVAGTLFLAVLFIVATSGQFVVKRVARLAAIFRTPLD